MNDATLHTADGRTVLEMERRLDHPVARVWRAITDPAELHHWFPADVEGDFAVGGTIRFPWRTADWPVGEGEVLEFDPPRVFGFTWGEETMRFELRPDGDDRCVMRFRHVFDNRAGAADFAAGWHVCFEALDAVLDGAPVPLPPDGEETPRWKELHEQYLSQLG
jgi:uncharacterized protein YndB with AHSA1/START domain